ncbi:MAG: hypothetical protein ABR577_18055 [Pyrinomonadaceae bacterium]
MSATPGLREETRGREQRKVKQREAQQGAEQGAALSHRREKLSPF